MDLDDEQPISSELARALCNRRTGVGADGFIRVGQGSEGARFTMELLNSDGSYAEISGNGVRCLVQAIAMAGAAPGASYDVATGGGIRAVTHRIGNVPGESWVSVDMGKTEASSVSPDDLDHELTPLKVMTLDIGNPHVVLLVDDVSAIDLAQLGPGYEQQFPAGANVEWIEPVDDSTIKMRVWERGAGITEACGTGACASARAANEWGLVSSDVSVVMPGGTVGVNLSATVTLCGPASFVATVDVDTQLLGL